jgi:SNF2 family N-terminal domain.
MCEWILFLYIRLKITSLPLLPDHCMVQFVKPNLLGDRKEFKNRFANPINNGQYIDSTPRDVKIMKRRAHVLYKMLDGIVQVILVGMSEAK